MSDPNPFLVLEQPCSSAIPWVVSRVEQAGLNVLRTFDLPVASLERADCPYPDYSKDQNDWQMVVMLVYGDDNQQVSLIAQSQSGRTWLSLVDTPQQRADPRLESVIRQALDLETNR